MSDYANGDYRKRLLRLQNWLIAVSIVVVFLGILIPTTVTYFLMNQSNADQLAVTCQTIETQVEITSAVKVNNEFLREIIRDLGLPTSPHEPIVVPEVPPECDGQ